MCPCLKQQGTLSSPCCRLSDHGSGWRMQAEKYRTSGRNDKKELVIESPLQYKDPAQGDVEAESSVLVRTRAPLRTVAVHEQVCQLLPGSDFLTCSVCLWRALLPPPPSLFLSPSLSLLLPSLTSLLSFFVKVGLHGEGCVHQSQ